MSQSVCPTCGAPGWPVWDKGPRGGSRRLGWECGSCTASWGDGTDGTEAAPTRTNTDEHRRTRTGTTVVPKIPHLDRGRPQRTVERRECDVQAEILTRLRLRKRRVLVTSRQRRKCRFVCEDRECRKQHPATQTVTAKCRYCGRVQTPWQADGDGCSKGIPDLFVSQGEGSILWAGIEVKGSDTAKSTEQAELEAEGRIVIVRSADEAEAALGMVAEVAA